MQGEQGERHGSAANHRDQNTVGSTRDVALDHAIAFKAVVDDGGSASCVEQSGSQTNQTTRWNDESQKAVFATLLHLFQLTSTQTNKFHDWAHHFGGDFHAKGFEWFMLFAIDLFEDHTRFSDAQFVTFATHRFDQYGEVKHTTSGDGVCFGPFDHRNSKSNIAFEFFLQASFDLTGGNVLAFSASQGR